MIRRRRVPQPPPFAVRRVNKKNPFSNLYRWLICVVIFLFAISINQMEDPLGEKVIAGVQYLLSTDNDYQPTIERIVSLGLQMENVDWPLFTNLGIKEKKETAPAMGAVTENPFKIPVSGAIIRHFGWQEGTEKGYKGFHEGIDIKAAIGTEVKAAEKGVVTQVGEDQILGLYITIDHGLDVKTLYGQLAEIKVEEGQQVERGAVIGNVGKSGIADEPHLHFEVSEKDKLINPLEKFNLQKDKGI